MRIATHSALPVVALHLLIACAVVAPAPEAVTVARVRAQEIWQRNMLIVDESVVFWKGHSGTAPHTADELTNAIEFFQVLTRIKGANFSFIGPIPDEGLEKLSAKWKAWHAAHGEQLTYDTSKQRVILTD